MFYGETINLKFRQCLNPNCSLYQFQYYSVNDRGIQCNHTIFEVKEDENLPR